MRILLAYDGTEGARIALESLDRAGLPADAEALVYCVADVLIPPQGAAPPAKAPGDANGVIQDAREIAEAGAAMLRRLHTGFEVSADAVADQPAWAIIKRAEGITKRGWSADLVILGEAGRSALGRFFVGSVAHHVLTNVCRSVRITRKGHVSAGLKLLLAVDGSPDAEAMVREVGRRNWPAGCEIRVLTAVQPDANPTGRSNADGAGAGPTEESNAKAVEDLRAAGLSAAGVIEEGDAIRTILEDAEDYKPDCIFLGARGLTRVQRFVLGTVSTSVAMRAICTVEVVHPPEQPAAV